MIKTLWWTLILVGLAAPAAADPAATAALNAYRTAQGRSTLTYSDRLDAAARAHAGDMARRGFFSHTGSNDSTVGDRVRAQGYRYCFVAENIAKGQRTLEQVMKSWKTSSGHRKNMLHNKATEFGLARADGDIWVMVLGTPGC